MPIIDLNQLPAPDVVEELDFETILAERKATLISLYPEDQQEAVARTLTLESEPLVKLLEENAYRELIWRQRVNEAARAVMLACAAGNDLDVIGANYNTTRLTITPADDSTIPPTPAVMESDTDYRLRIQQAFEGLSVAGSVGAYQYHGRSADGRVADISVTSPSPACVTISVLSRENNGVASEDLLAVVRKLNLTQMAVGDANGVLPTPDPAQTKLINQKRIAPLNLLSVDPNNQSQIIAEQIIPENEGGFWNREIGLYDDEGVLIAVANCPETYKPQLQEGSGRTQTIRMILVVTNTEAITLKIDPSVVLATRKYVDDEVLELRLYVDDQMRNHIAAQDPHTQYAQKHNPTFTGEPKAPTPDAGNNTTRIATTAFVQAAITALINGAPATLDTLKEIAAAINNDPKFSTTINNALAGKQPLDNTLTHLSGKDVAGLLAYLGFGEGANWVMLPGGMIIQRVYLGFPVGTNVRHITFPRSFTTTNYSISINWNDIGTVTTETQSPANVAVVHQTKSLTGASIWQAGPGGFNVDIIAVGY